MKQEERYWKIQRHEIFRDWEFDQLVKGKFEDAVAAARATLERAEIYEIRFGEWNPNTLRTGYTVYMPQGL